MQTSPARVRRAPRTASGHSSHSTYGVPSIPAGQHRPPTPASSSKLTPFLGSIPRFTPCWAQIPLLTCLPLVQTSLRVSEPGLITEERQG